MANKEIVSSGSWQTGKMPRAAFPLSKSGEKAYRLGNRRWRVVEFRVLGMEGRLLVNFSVTLGQYQALLGMVVAGDTKILAQLEYQPTHAGWHAHVACDPIASIPSGIRRGPWVRKLKRGPAYLMKRPFDFSEADALGVAYRFYRMDRISPSDRRLV